jgi:hypothetical protein
LPVLEDSLGFFTDVTREYCLCDLRWWKSIQCLKRGDL